MAICSICPRRCGANRGDNIGYCGVGEEIKLSKYMLHLWEEPCIENDKGAGCVFFAGCNLRCVYCQNYEISHNCKGEYITTERLAEIFCELENAGAYCIDLVNPTHYIEKIESALNIYKPSIPVVWNSSGFEGEEILTAAAKFTDIFLMDFKYMSPERAKKYSNAENYPEIAKNALDIIYKTHGECEFIGDKMKRGIIVRHLLLPQGTRDAISVFDFVYNNYPNVWFSLMAQYIPVYKASQFKEINRKITKREYNKVVDYILATGFENCFIQELSSATDKYIPKF